MSPYPDSFQGSPYLFGGALFALILMSSFGAMLATVFGRHLWLDRRERISTSTALCSVFFMICCVMVMRCLPEAIWMISYAELPPAKRTAIANVKRFLDLFALAPVVIWMTVIIAWKDEILLRLKAPTARIWVDYRYHSIKRVIPLGLLCAAFALAVTLARAYQ